MSETITYSLSTTQSNSDSYYHAVANFTDEVILKMQIHNTIVANFQEHLRINCYEEPRTSLEYHLELLALGTLWYTYSRAALDLDDLPHHLLTTLVHFRHQNTLFKPGIDALRGILGTLFLNSENSDQGIASFHMPLEKLAQLLKWLEATGEFQQDVQRFSLWYNYFSLLPPETVVSHLTSVLALALWFTEHSLEALGCFTVHVESFLHDIHPSYRWREDRIFCGRERVEYHLNMVGAEMMNRAFRPRFLHTESKELLLPACMRAHPAKECQACVTADGTRCSSCTPGCNVHALTQLGSQWGFGVCLIDHESSLNASLMARWANQQTTGVIGVACVLNLLGGGWKLRAAGIPAQCILLDYCGCKNHWHPEGVTTELNTAQLKQVLGFVK